MKKLTMLFIIRSVVVVLFLSTVVTSQSCDSPTSSCDCFVENGKKIINCRYKNLTEIPTFTNKNQVYDEIRFTSFEQTGQCAPTSGCNKIRQIGADAFANLKVKKIDLLNNPVTSIDPAAFTGLAPEVESISLEGDGSNVMPYSALAALDQHLKVLHLEHYGSTVISTPIVFPFPNLQSLTLENWERLNTIEADVFNIMENLKELKLRHLRGLQILPVPAIIKFLNLTSIEIMDTGITQIYGDTFSPMSKLNEVKVTNNRNLNTIDQRAFSGVTDTLEFLDLDNNNLNNIEFLRNEDWSVLSHLNIGYNFNLRSLPTGVFSRTPTLAYLQCQDIGLTSINKEMFTGLANLHTLDLAYNQIKTVFPETFQNSPALVELRLHDQNTNGDLIDFQNNAFSGVEASIETLSIFNNLLNVSQMWIDVSKLTNLLILEVMDTGIESIPDKVFKNNKKLTNLHMADNNLTSVKQETFFGPRTTLTTIDLQRNQILTVDQCTLNDFSVRPTLMLAGNPLICDCGLLWLYNWFKLQSDQDLVAMQEIGKCMSPPSLANKYFTQFSRDEMCSGGSSVITCPDIYATTTTSTTTSTTTTTTTPVPTTPPLPYFELRIVNREPETIEVTWVINDLTYVTGLKLEMRTNYQAIRYEYPGTDATSYKFFELRPSTSHTICLVLKIEDEYRENAPSCKSTETLSPFTTPSPSTIGTTPEPDSQLGVIIGAAVGGTVLVALIIAILVILLRSNKPKKQKPQPEPVSFTMKADVPHAGGTARRFAKKMEEKGATPDDINITVISNGDMTNKGRISAGSYQELNEKGVDTHPMPSSMGHYANSVEGRPLPNAPKGATGHGYVNTGFKNSAEHLPETSKNEYMEVRY